MPRTSRRWIACLFRKRPTLPWRLKVCNLRHLGHDDSRWSVGSVTVTFYPKRSCRQKHPACQAWTCTKLGCRTQQATCCCRPGSHAASNFPLASCASFSSRQILIVQSGSNALDAKTPDFRALMEMTVAQWPSPSASGLPLPAMTWSSCKPTRYCCQMLPSFSNVPTKVHARAAVPSWLQDQLLQQSSPR